MRKHFSLVNGVRPDAWHQVLEDALRPYGSLEVIREDEAVSKLITNKYDTTILDSTNVKEIKLLTQRLIAQRPESRVVVVTSAPSWELARDVLQSGAVDCIAKKDAKDDLQALFGEILSRPVPKPLWLSQPDDSKAAKTPILLADNQLDYLKIWKEILEREDYIVLPAATSIEAERVLKREEVVLAILDLRLDNDDDDMDESGLRLAKELAPSVSKIILTRHPEYKSVQEALAVGANGLRATVDFVDKTESKHSILAAVHKAVTLAKLRRSEDSGSLMIKGGPTLAIVALLLAVAAGIVAISTGDPRWLLGTILFVIFVIVFVGFGIKRYA